MIVLNEHRTGLNQVSGKETTEDLRHEFPDTAAYEAYWSERYQKMIAKGYGPVDASEGAVRVSAIIGKFVFNVEFRSYQEEQPAPFGVCPFGEPLTQEEAALIGGQNPVRTKDDAPDKCQAGCRDGKVRVKGVDRDCIACRGTGFKQKRQDYQEPMPAMPEHRTPVTDALRGKAYTPQQREGETADQAIERIANDARLLDCTYTVVQSGGEYRTLRVRTENWGKDGKVDIKTTLDYLNGPDNSRDFVTCGFINKDRGSLVVWSRYRSGTFEAELQRAFDVIISSPKACATAYALRSGRCGICGRELTTPESIEAGIGPKCAARAGW